MTKTITVDTSAEQAATSGNDNAMDMLDKLHEKQVAWNKKHYKGTMDRLMVLLGECLEVYELLVKDKKARKVLDAKLKELGLYTREGVHLSTRVVRYVFRLTNSRAAAYARVLQCAAEANVETGKLGSWVAERGGIEAVRRMQKDGKTAAQIAVEKVDTAADALADADALVSIAKLPTQLHATHNAMGDYSLAIIRHNKQTGQGDVVWGTDNAALMKKVLVIVSKDIDDNYRTITLTKTSTQKRLARHAALNTPVNNNNTDDTEAA